MFENYILRDRYKIIDFLETHSSATGSPSLIFDFVFINEQHIHSRIYHPIVQAGFEGRCEAVKTDVIECPQGRDFPRASIDRQMYSSLQNWQHWVEAEALTSRYVYRFHDNSTYDSEEATIFDQKTSKSVSISYNSYTVRRNVKKCNKKLLLHKNLSLGQNSKYQTNSHQLT